jgi:hypothetical protein
MWVKIEMDGTYGMFLSPGLVAEVDDLGMHKQRLPTIYGTKIYQG